MSKKRSRKEEENVSEGKKRRSRSGKNERGREEARDIQMIALGVQKKMKNKAEWTPSEHTSGGNYKVEEDDLEAEKYEEKRSMEDERERSADEHEGGKVKRETITGG